MKRLRAPFPWFGGKSRAAHLVWAAFGDVPNYVEPFAGSLAVLLARPTPARIETVNDVDCYLSNFWRAVQAQPEEVARCADWPVNEADLHARHRWLVYGEGAAEFREAMKHDPDLYDAKRAGWWVWGLCQWIGSGWCAMELANGEHPAKQNKKPRARGVGVNSEPVLAHSNRGVHLVSEQLPDLGGNGGAAGKGVHASGKTPKMDRGGASRMACSVDAIVAWMQLLQARLRRVRVCCGDWKRVLGRSPTECIGLTGVFLDPPYSDAAGRDGRLYSHDDLSVAHEVREWALEHGDNKKLRIALCGYEGEHEMPASWQCVAWKANGGYASSAGNHENAKRERIWFSPACLPVHERQASLFAAEAAS